MKNKIIINFLLCASLLFSTSCVTKAIWGDKSYDENVEQFFVGSDGRYVVLIGEKYHYIFTDDSGLFKTILMLRQKGILTLDTNKSHLKVDGNNNINGNFTISGPYSILPPSDIKTLRGLGFSGDKDDEVSIKIKLSGRRYAAKYIGQNTAVTNVAYTIPIYYNDSGVIKDVGKAAITPVAVTLDAVLLIGKIVIYPLML
jgi:hypothetical protein